MKIMLVTTLTFFSTLIHAELYKCTLNKQLIYQDQPCEETGTVGQKFKISPDISKEQQHEAMLRLESEIALMAEQDKLKQEADDRERKVRAEEEKSFSIQEHTEQVRRQAKALEKRNYIESQKPRVIYNNWDRHSNLTHPKNEYDTKQVTRPFVQEQSKASVSIFPKKFKGNKPTDNKHKK